MPFTFWRNKRYPYSSTQRRLRPQPLILILILLILIFSETRMFPLFLLVLPFLLFWLFGTLTSILFQRISQKVEEFWRYHLEIEDDPLVEEQVSYPQQQEPPESVRNDERLLMLWERAMKFRNEKGLQRVSKDILRQTHALGDLFGRFQILLRAKLRPDELSYRRFLNSATQAYEIVIEELNKALSRVEQLQSIEGSLRPTADDVEFESPTYQSLYQEQLGQTRQLLSQTQEAVAQLARVNISIGQMRGASAQREGDASHAIHELKDLADRAKQL